MSLFILILCLFLARGDAHGFVSDPRQRGALNIRNHITQAIDDKAPIDYECHFPAGDKSTVPGSGFRSVKSAAGNNWTPYEPLNPFFKWRCGVCGDHLYHAQDHLRGGRYYWDAKRVQTYEQGSVVFFESEIITHHNGFYEFYVCDIDRCGDDISPRCFTEGHCTKLIRARGPCDSGDHPGCGPIDRNYPGRWYLPCITSEPMMVGGNERTIAYVLPPWLVCDHCVIQWYWTAANTCNPPGVADYFTGPDAPRWKPCAGQGGAVGGWTSSKGECGGDAFPEEYWQCSDVRIVPRGAPLHGHDHGSGAHVAPPHHEPAHHEPHQHEPHHHEPHHHEPHHHEPHHHEPHHHEPHHHEPHHHAPQHHEPHDGGHASTAPSHGGSSASTGSGNFAGARSKNSDERHASEGAEASNDWETGASDGSGANSEVDTASALGLS
ncbi:hypothetical protein FGB62_37g00 [Gracilaria domingensis]|nr:hypothetical protein FGB62_37g00 [Gracilaria domingensis]